MDLRHVLDLDIALVAQWCSGGVSWIRPPFATLAELK